MRLLTLLISFFLAQTTFAKVTSETIKTKVGATNFRNEVFQDEAVAAPRPGVLLLPEWWGVTALERQNARRLAEQGYVVLVADLFGNGYTTMNPNDANAAMVAAQEDPQKLESVFHAALAALAARPGVDRQRIAIVGFGFGGGIAVDRARHGLQAKAVVDFFGGLNPPNGKDQAKSVAAEILVIAGEHDAFVTEHQFKSFRKEMTAAEARFTIEVLPNTFHDFIRPGVDAISKKSEIPMKYDAESTKKAWALVDAFLQRKLKD